MQPINTSLQFNGTNRRRFQNLTEDEIKAILESERLLKLNATTPSGYSNLTGGNAFDPAKFLNMSGSELQQLVWQMQAYTNLSEEQKVELAYAITLLNSMNIPENVTSGQNMTSTETKLSDNWVQYRNLSLEGLQRIVESKQNQMNLTPQDLVEISKVRTYILWRYKSDVLPSAKNKKRLDEGQLAGLTEGEKTIFMNQYRVRMAAQTIADIQNATGEIGPRVSNLALGIDGSVDSTMQNEKAILSRSGLMRLFFGGDEKAAADLNRTVSANQAKIQELGQLASQCECDSEVQQFIGEQLEVISQEQERLAKLAESELKDKGLIGWLLK
ncbi:MAG: hypothetical protein NTU61_00495 [Candidatus Altiarchaeota archaeon]|nr:hypothetical protein [Candidatus Altiarchaeota archaeon]